MKAYVKLPLVTDQSYDIYDVMLIFNSWDNLRMLQWEVMSTCLTISKAVKATKEVQDVGPTAPTLAVKVVSVKRCSSRECVFCETATNVVQGADGLYTL